MAAQGHSFYSIVDSCHLVSCSGVIGSVLNMMEKETSEYEGQEKELVNHSGTGRVL